MLVFDPITLKILWERLISISAEMAATLVRTSFSTIVREGNDYACVLLDARGNSLAQAEHSIPSFIGTMPITGKHFLRKFPPESLEPGDSLITNDPWLATGHLPDMTIATPIFYQGKLVAFAGTVAHMPDIGGVYGRGLTREIFEEGLRIPMMKLFCRGEPNEDLFDLIRENVRVPEQTVGDILGMVAANTVGAQRLMALMEEAHLEDLIPLVQEIHQRSEEAMRSAIKEMPDGAYHGEITVDGYDAPIHVQAQVTINGDSMEIDYTGSSPQTPWAINSVMNYTFAYTAYIIKCVTVPALPNNEGCFRPIRVIAPEGSIMNAKPPAATVMRHVLGHIAHGALFSALAQAVPDRVMAHSGSAPLTTHSFNGMGRNGRNFVQIVTANGGTGACPQKDGESASFPSNLSNTPVEMMEANAPLLIEEKALIPDSAGAGRFRGGWGQRMTFRNVAQTPITHALLFNRLRYAAQGLLGGQPGTPNQIWFNDAPHPQPRGRWVLQPNERVTVEYPGGGGLHDPLTRNPQRVLQDVRNGLISLKKAATDYGVIIDPTRWTVDDEATEKQRRHMAQRG
jgi:N-methylhydantoinase B